MANDWYKQKEKGSFFWLSLRFISSALCLDFYSRL